MKKPNAGEYYEYYAKYIDAISDPFGELESQLDWYLQFIEENKSRLDYAYDEGKWTIRQCIMHVVDTEIIFANRLLRISRGDTSPLPGFEQNDYINNTDYSHLTAEDLKNTFSAVRKSSIALINALSEKQYELLGTASGQKVSVRALIFKIPGHAMHHKNIFTERYV